MDPYTISFTHVESPKILCKHIDSLSVVYVCTWISSSMDFYVISASLGVLWHKILTSL